MTKLFRCGVRRDWRLTLIDRDALSAGKGDEEELVEVAEELDIKGGALRGSQWGELGLGVFGVDLTGDIDEGFGRGDDAGDGSDASIGENGGVAEDAGFFADGTGVGTAEQPVRVLEEGLGGMELSVLLSERSIDSGGFCEELALPGGGQAEVGLEATLGIKGRDFHMGAVWISKVVVVLLGDGEVQLEREAGEESEAGGEACFDSCGVYGGFVEIEHGWIPIDGDMHLCGDLELATADIFDVDYGFGGASGKREFRAEVVDFEGGGLIGAAENFQRSVSDVDPEGGAGGLDDWSDPDGGGGRCWGFCGCGGIGNGR